MYVELNAINKRFGHLQVADQVSCSIEKGKLVGLLGPSGSGKTTLLRMIAGLDSPDNGEIIIDGECVNHVPAAERNIGFVFQSYALFRHMTIFDNIAFGLTIQKKEKAYIQDRVHELICLIGLEGLEKRRPYQLSGGQRQRVAFARALAPNPHLLLLDEPFAAIDAKVRKELRSWLRETINQVGITSIFVTHDQDEAMEVADQIIIVNKGHVEQIDTPLNIYKNPATPFVALFAGESMTIHDYSKFNGFAFDPKYEKALIRPEFIQITPIKKEVYIHASERGVVTGIFFRGSMLEIQLLIRGMTLTAYRLLNDDPIQVGETVSALIYRMYFYNDHEVCLVENASLQNNQLFFI